MWRANRTIHMFMNLCEKQLYIICDTLQASFCDILTPVRTINIYYNPLEFTWQVKQRFQIT